jgi:hypothetical protein
LPNQEFVLGFLPHLKEATCLIKLKTDNLLGIFPEIAKKLGEKFNYFTSHHEFALIPVMHVLTKKVFEEFRQNPEKYGITDIAEGYKPQMTIVAVNGNIVRISVTETELPDEDCDTYWYFNSGLAFEGKETAVSDLLKSITVFAASLDQAGMMEEAKKSIENCGIYPRPKEWKEFYGV